MIAMISRLVALVASLAAAPPVAPRPRLVVVITVDQLRPDYLDRYRPQLKSGLAMLLKQGAVFTEAYHDHAITETAPRHDSVGALARAHRHHSQPGGGAGLGHAAHRRHRDRSVPGAVPGDGAVRLAQGGRADGAGAVGVGEGPRGHPADRPCERAGLLVRRRRVHDQPLLRRLAAPVGAGVQWRARPVPRGGDAVEPIPPRARLPGARQRAL